MMMMMTIIINIIKPICRYYNSFINKNYNPIYMTLFSEL